MDEGLIKRVLPHSMEAEQSVIGAMLMDSDAIVTASEQVDKEDFYGKQYGIMFEAIVDLYNAGKPVDIVTLQEKLKEMNVPPELSSIEFIKTLFDAVPTSTNIKYYAGIVKEKATLRRLIKTNEEIENMCYAGSEPLDSVLEITEKKIFNLLRAKPAGDYVPIKEVVIEALKNIELSAKTTGNVTGLPTGFTDLDTKTAGFHGSELILIAARPAMGKTAFELNIAQYMAFRKDITVAIFSLEMSKEQIVNRLFSLESHVDSQKIRTGNLEDSDWENLIESAGVIGKSNLIIDDTPGITISELRS